jgi:hypothetical protein
MGKIVTTLMIIGAAMSTPLDAPSDQGADFPLQAPAFKAVAEMASPPTTSGAGDMRTAAAPEVPSSAPAPHRIVSAPSGARRLATMAMPADLGWTCNFRREDIARGVRVRLAVAVDAYGAPTSVTVLDPRNGFGEAARACAMTMRFLPARDSSGRPIAGTTAPFIVSFEGN